MGMLLSKDSKPSTDNIRDQKDDGERVMFDESYECINARHAVHAIIWAPWDTNVEKGQYEPKAAVMMQMRSDGHIGFPGGMVDEKICETSQSEAKSRVTAAINRECFEEINLDTRVYTFQNNDYMYTEYFREKSFYCHFYALKVSIEDYIEIEKAAISAHDFGDEVFGIFRVPLFTMEDGVKGLPAFLCNSFIGNSRDQLLFALVELDILADEDVEEAKLIARGILLDRGYKLAQKECVPDYGGDFLNFSM